MLFLSKINGYDLNERSLCAEYHVSEDCLFYDPVTGAVPAWAGFEFIAQAISAFTGLVTRARGEEPKIGFIMSVSSMHLWFPQFEIGSTAEIRVKEINSIDMVYTFEGEIFVEGRKILKGRLTVMDTTDEQIEKLKSI